MGCGGRVGGAGDVGGRAGSVPDPAGEDSPLSPAGSPLADGLTPASLAEKIAAETVDYADWEQKRLATDTGIAKPQWAQSDYDDSRWSAMTLPGMFDVTGPDVDGAVWFRREVHLDRAGPATLHLGAIDDFDTTFVNGVEVGRTGSDTPNWWQTPRAYDVPAGVLAEGRNVIAVRVFDQWLKGGFVGPASEMRLEVGEASVPLAGPWQSAWERAIVPDVDLTPPEAGYPQNQPTTLFNAMVSPVTPYATRGFLWYQGENNSGRPAGYARLLGGLMDLWRAEFAGPDARPFLVVQLANFQARTDDPAADFSWTRLQVEQAKAVVADAEAGLAVILDVGDPADIHPTDKRTVGERLARLALADTYGRDVAAHSPAPAGASLDGGDVLVTFDHAAGLTLVGDEQHHAFAVQDAAGTWHWATPTLEGAAVRLASPAAEPVAVRYAWQMNPPAVVYNAAGLPAGPFEVAVGP